MKNAELINESANPPDEASLTRVIAEKQEYDQWLRTPQTQKLLAHLRRVRERHVELAENKILTDPAKVELISVHMVNSALTRQLIDTIEGRL